MSANQLVAGCNKTGYSGDAVPGRLLPIGINGVFESAIRQRLPDRIRRQPGRLSDVDKHIGISNVAAVDEVGLVERIVDGFETRLRVRPFRKFLGEAAVVGVRPPVVRQAFGVHQTFHAGMHGLEVQATSGEQVLQRAATRGRVGVQRKIDPFHIDVEISLQPFNTPGTEIAPGSNEVGKYFEFDWFNRHDLSILKRTP